MDQDGVRWWIFLTVMLNLKVPWKAGDCGQLSDCDLFKIILLHGVGRFMLPVVCGLHFSCYKRCKESIKWTNFVNMYQILQSIVSFLCVCFSIVSLLSLHSHLQYSEIESLTFPNGIGPVVIFYQPVHHGIKCHNSCSCYDTCLPHSSTQCFP